MNHHMDICKVEGIQCTGKRKMSKSRKKGNQLIASGVVAKKEYSPLPTGAVELVQAIRKYCKNKKGAKVDEELIVRQVIQPQYGSDLEGFETLGFGLWKQFIDANPIAMQFAELRVVTESVKDAEVDVVESRSEYGEDTEAEEAEVVDEVLSKSESVNKLRRIFLSQRRRMKMRKKPMTVPKTAANTLTPTKETTCLSLYHFGWK